MKVVFAGDAKVGQSILTGPERALVAWATPRIPSWLQTYHLTLLTVVWSGLNMALGWLAASDLRWLWGISLVIVLQYLSDLFDGAVGRARNTGLVKWGFYMDHFLDYIFLGSLIFAGYMIAPEGLGAYYVLLLLLTGGFMVSSFLSFAATNRFEIYILGFGPTETRIVFIALNTIIIFTGTAHFHVSLPVVCLLCFLGLAMVVKRASDALWQLDMEQKAGSQP
jgi:archaetidylinositol phosphate synthase